MKHIVTPIAAWFVETPSPLPWRADCNPYRIWISEIMLQQTRIEAVIPYYTRFLAAFPTVQALAEADDDRLMKHWEGLGYYSRARNLKKAAIEIVARHGGTLPSDPTALRTLPGIGEYTAGAIASIAYGVGEPAVDGNVLRVISRVTASSADIALPKTKRDVTDALRAVYPTGKAAGSFTEGLMELGEQICLPLGTPKCEICPIREQCEAHRTDTVEHYPVKSEKKGRRGEDYTVFLLRTSNNPPCYAIRKRPAEGLLAGMWEFPQAPGHLDTAAAREFWEEAGCTVTDVAKLGSARHIFSHIEWHMVGYEVTVTRIPDSLFSAPADEILLHYAIPTAFRHYTKKLRG